MTDPRACSDRFWQRASHVGRSTSAVTCRVLWSSVGRGHDRPKWLPGNGFPTVAGPQWGCGHMFGGETVACRPCQTTPDGAGGKGQRCCTPPAQPSGGQDLSGDRSLMILKVPGVEGTLIRCRDPVRRRRRSQMAALPARPANPAWDTSVKQSRVHQIRPALWCTADTVRVMHRTPSFENQDSCEAQPSKR